MTVLADARRALGFREPSARTALLVIYICGLAFGSLNSTIVNVTLPDIALEFGVGSGAVGTISVAYLVGYAVAIPASAWFGDRFGGRTVLLGSIAGFAVFSTLCGLCQNLPELIIARAAQGVSGGITVPVGLAMLYRAVPGDERVRLGALVSIPPSIAQALGPVIGGSITTYLGWRWAFLLNLPLGAVVVIFGALYFRDDEHRSSARLDFLGLLLASVGVCALLFALSAGPQHGWVSLRTVGFAVVGLSGLAGLAGWELVARAPLLDFRLWRRRLFASATAIVFVCAIVFTSWLYLISQYLQVSRGFSPLAAGLATLPQTLGVIIGAALTSRLLYARLGPRWTSMLGLGLVATSVLAEAVLLQRGPTWALLVACAVTGAATPLAFECSQIAGFARTSHADLPKATALYNSVKQIGGAVGVGVVTSVTLLAAGPGHHDQVIRDFRPYQDALLVLAALAALAVLVAHVLPDPDGSG